MRIAALLLLASAAALPARGADDSRQLVEFPEPMREHMLGNMRDHLLALSEIQAALAAGAYDEAARVAEGRIGMSSLNAHGAAHMAGFMPREMQEIGSAMHRAASRFALAAQDAAVDGKLARPLDALAQVTRQCVACHAAYRVR